MYTRHVLQKGGLLESRRTRFTSCEIFGHPSIVQWREGMILYQYDLYLGDKYGLYFDVVDKRDLG